MMGVIVIIVSHLKVENDRIQNRIQYIYIHNTFLYRYI